MGASLLTPNVAFDIRFDLRLVVGAVIGLLDRVLKTASAQAFALERSVSNDHP